MTELPLLPLLECAERWSKRPGHVPAAVIACLLLTAVAPAQAQLHRATDPVATPASSLVLQDDALALDVNPAALGKLPSWSLALLHSEIDVADSWIGHGDALY